jgi:tryptophan 2,3-dioxygenase
MRSDFSAVVDVVREIERWGQRKVAKDFPFEVLLGHLREVGQHFLRVEILEILARFRVCGVAIGDEADRLLLFRFFDTILDKYDKRYDYATYIGLSLLAQPVGVEWRERLGLRDRRVSLLLADLIRFERDADGGMPHAPGDMPPPSRLVGKRLRLAVRVMEPAAARVPGLGRTSADAVLDGATDLERRLLLATMQPVYTLHDEYLFLRVLQAFEETFSFMAVALAEVVRKLCDRQSDDVAETMWAVADTLRESLPLFSLLATMQPEAFQTFRKFTDGASAIQSESYKAFECLCATPERARLESPAFTSVPWVRAEVLDGRATVYDSWRQLVVSGGIDEVDSAVILSAAHTVESIHQRWKQTHYRLAVRMIGLREGTGATEGVPYLNAVLANRLFPNIVQRVSSGEFAHE